MTWPTFIFSVILVVAALLKIKTFRETYEDQLVSAAYQIGVILAEFGLAIWLLSGYRPYLSNVAALTCLAAFSGYNFFLIIENVPRCGCFGKAKISPWVAFSLDLIMFALLYTIPSYRPKIGHGRHLLRLARFVGVAVIGYLAGSLTDHSFLRTPQLTVTPSLIKFGNIASNHSIVKKVNLTNNTKDTITISSIDISCTCLSIDNPPVVFGPGSRNQLEIRFEPDRSQDFQGRLIIEVTGKDDQSNVLFKLLVDANIVNSSM